MKIIYHCRCGESHEIDKDKPVWIDFFNVTKGLSSKIHVTVGKRTWAIPRMYIAIHGIKGKDISKLGFKEL